MIADRLRKAVLQAAMEGKLTKQLDNDSSVYQLITEVHKIDNDYLWEIPKKWAWVKFGDLVDFKMGKTPERANPIYWGNDVPWISIADMNNQSFIMETKEKVSNSALESIFKEQISPKGTLIMSFKLTVGKTSILGIDALHNEAIISIFPKKEPDTQKKYLYFVLPEIANMGETKDAIKGKTLNSKSIYNLLIPLPPIEEQKRIVEKLEVLLAEIDKLEQDEKALKDLEDKFPERLKSAILRNAVSGKLTNQNLEVETTEDIIVLLEKKKNEKIEVIKSYNKQPFDIPENWRWIKIGDLGTMGMGQTLLKKDMVEKGDPVYSATISDDPLGYVNKDNNKLKLTKGDFVIPARGASIGYVNLIKVDEASSTQTTMYIKSYLPSISNYIYYCLLGMKKDVFTTTGTAQPQITVGLTKEQLIPLPPLEEQKRIVDKLDELFKIDLLNI